MQAIATSVAAVQSIAAELQQVPEDGSILLLDAGGVGRRPGGTRAAMAQTVAEASAAKTAYLEEQVAKLKEQNAQGACSVAGRAVRDVRLRRRRRRAPKHPKKEARVRTVYSRPSIRPRQNATASGPQGAGHLAHVDSLVPPSDRQPWTSCRRQDWRGEQPWLG